MRKPAVKIGKTPYNATIRRKACGVGFSHSIRRDPECDSDASDYLEYYTGFFHLRQYVFIKFAPFFCEI